MGRLAIILFALLLFSGCATLHQPVNTLLMTGPQKIQNYEETIDHYQFLIEQEKLKMSLKK